MRANVLGTREDKVKKIESSFTWSSVRPTRGEIALSCIRQGAPWHDGDVHAGGTPRLGVREGFLEEGTADSGASQVHRQGRVFQVEGRAKQGSRDKKRNGAAAEPKEVWRSQEVEFGIRQTMRRGKLKEKLMAFHSRQKLF